MQEFRCRIQLPWQKEPKIAFTTANNLREAEKNFIGYIKSEELKRKVYFKEENNVRNSKA